MLKKSMESASQWEAKATARAAQVAQQKTDIAALTTELASARAAASAQAAHHASMQASLVTRNAELEAERRQQRGAMEKMRLNAARAAHDMRASCGQLAQLLPGAGPLLEAMEALKMGAQGVALGFGGSLCDQLPHTIYGCISVLFIWERAFDHPRTCARFGLHICFCDSMDWLMDLPYAQLTPLYSTVRIPTSDVDMQAVQRSTTLLQHFLKAHQLLLDSVVACVGEGNG